MSVDAEGALVLDGTTGDVDVQTAVSGSSVKIDGANVKGAGTVTADSSTLDITATGTDGIALTGTLVADNGATTLAANNGAISAANDANDFQSVTANAKGVTLKDADEVTHGDEGRRRRDGGRNDYCRRRGFRDEGCRWHGQRHADCDN